MRLLSWMQNKLNGKHGGKNSNATPAINHVKKDIREEFSDWPHGLLAIGTFGNNEVKESAIETLGNNGLKESHGTQDIQEDPSSSEDDVQDFTPEEVDKLQKELTQLLSKKSNSKVEKEIAELPLDRFLNCPSSLEISRRISNALCIESDDKSDDIDKTISIILGRCKEICANKSKKSIGIKSLSFLFKKMFVCSSGFAPAPSLRDTLQESGMEKLLRTLLHKKISPQSSSRTSSMKKFIEDKYLLKDKNEDEKHEKIDDGCKWVKTDSECCALPGSKNAYCWMRKYR